MEVEKEKSEYDPCNEEEHKESSMEDKLIESEVKIKHQTRTAYKKKSEPQSKILDNIHSPNKKSLEATRFMKSKITELIEEDERQAITLKDIDLFCSGDFDVLDNQQGRTIKHIREWTKLQSENEDLVDNYKEIDDTDKIKEKAGYKNKINSATYINNDNIQNKENIIFKNKIIKPINPISYTKNCGIEIELQFLMAGESSFYIFSRADYFTSDMAVCYIEKELDSSRKFINFAILKITNDANIIKTLKKQEIPKYDDNYINSLDICEVNLVFIDFCDNKCTVIIKNNSSENDFFLYADVFSSVDEIANIMVGATGDLISLKKFSINEIKKNIRRSTNENVSDKIRQTCCCALF